jgi:hypothetical protein
VIPFANSPVSASPGAFLYSFATATNVAVLDPGTYWVGYCVQNVSNLGLSVGFVTGWVMVTN